MSAREGSGCHSSAVSDPAARSLLLVHGAGSGPWIFESWSADFPHVRVHAPDLHERLDVAHASMHDYANRVVSAAATLPRPVALCGWSMGGLVVLMAAARVRPHSVVLIEPSPPAEAQGFAPDTALRRGTFDPEQVYGTFPPGVVARPESEFARAERKRGISVPALPCPSLVVSGDEFPEERGTRVAALYGAKERRFPGLDHWGLILDPQVRSAIAAFLATA